MRGKMVVVSICGGSERVTRRGWWCGGRSGGGGSSVVMRLMASVEWQWGGRRVVMTMELWREGSVVVTRLGWPEGWLKSGRSKGEAPEKLERGGGRLGFVI
ncbi:hypothetical protein Tco_0984812 [Tanacetum coccineum]